MATQRITEQLSVIAAGGWCSLMLVSEGQEMNDVVMARLNPETLASLQNALAGESLPWTNADESVRISRVDEGLNLTYALAGPPWRISLTLDQQQTMHFRRAIAAASE